MRRRVVVAPDKFKGSATAQEAAVALGRGLRRVGGLIVVEHPVADGGEGTVDMLTAHGFRGVTAVVQGPLGEPTTATLALSADGRTAVIEAAQAAGFSALGRPVDRYSALNSSTYGLGELLLTALDHGARKLVVGLGGTVTTDGGVGALQALGARVADPGGDDVAPGGAGLATAEVLDAAGIDPRLADAEIVIATDVSSPLLGKSGAAAIYGPQKGAGPTEVQILDQALTRWVHVMAAWGGRDQLPLAEGGAAGGLAFGLSAVLGARLTPGIDLLLEESGFDAVLRGADLVIVGEGSLDEQSLHGKGPLGVAHAAQRLGVPVIAVVGRCQISRSQQAQAGFTQVYSLTELAGDEQSSLTRATELLEYAGTEVGRAWIDSRRAGGGGNSLVLSPE